MFRRESLSNALLNRRMLICIFTGFVSGLPLYVLVTLVPVWLKQEGVSLTEIGLFALIGFPYTWKFVWSPLMDYFRLPVLGRLRGWMLITQLGMLISIAGLGLLSPSLHIGVIAAICVITAFLSASQDIVLDAYRREILPDAELGMGNSIHVNAYRLAGLIPGSLSLILADHLPWSAVFIITALFLFIGIGLTLCIDEPKISQFTNHNFEQAVIKPFHEFFSRLGIKQALYILTFMFLYKLGDSMATALSTPFYLDIGFSMTEIGLIAKHAGLWPMIIGGLLGGALMVRIGINRALWLFGLVQITSILGFAVLAQANSLLPSLLSFITEAGIALTEQSAKLWLLGLVISFEYLGVGLGTAAFVAFIARTTSPEYTMTQFALFTALAALPRTFANASTGLIVEQVGWTNFYLICTLLAIPGMLMLFKVAPWNEALENGD